ncbi:DUF3536 domain-containing protein [Parasphaerochaeta coccoides]|uniref:Glycoside hydrolase family 57 n=1 Tax=Parasphaerochaeta coccoides (strain ATCC BAA-1237 / DSM 17374 / SPN1) TaxID=760011 RepID=F4GKX4_PARC1|nr:DUF3536 domain-containing protein [Parasphaerochaeta coccoides]AEC01887.1 glycoside hydrolase family 57 [Parasphaerochaeta coccoides DSM 17374]
MDDVQTQKNTLVGNKAGVPVILHGHFYQPPRENPRTGIIPVQPSARHYSDWNERILADCYSANAFSRYLTNTGRIESITNNYSWISFNFGPTLLSWIKKQAPVVYERILAADAESTVRLGHGNAMAQAFGHSILPLDNARNRLTQIRWGLDDFSSRFKRAAEGLWLPETAINGDVIDTLVAEGVRFVILSPWQASAVETSKGTWDDLDGAPAPYGRPYIITGSTGRTLTAFFYHPGLAEGISFGHLLHDADNLYERIRKIRLDDGQSLIHTATDGEIYGHHEPYGDMALAALIRKINDRGEFFLTNYATYLDSHPAELHARLKPGEGRKGTSWSCFHGVSRWYKDCGCHTGGDDSWNQKWRTPLRTAFENNEKRLDTIFKESFMKIAGIEDPRAADDTLLRYGPVAGEEMDGKTFLDNLDATRLLDDSRRSSLAILLDGMKNLLYSYTSCGWFFNDIAGIEPRQCISYALSAISTFSRFSSGEDLLAPFLADLKPARSNEKPCLNGVEIAIQENGGISGSHEAALFFFLNTKMAKPFDRQEQYGYFRLLDCTWNGDRNATIRFVDTCRQIVFSADVEQTDEASLNLVIAVTDAWETDCGRLSLTLYDIPARLLKSVYSWISHSLATVTNNDIPSIANDIANYSLVVKNTKFQPFETLWVENIGTAILTIRSLFALSAEKSWPERKESIEQLLGFIVIRGRQAEISTVSSIFSTEIRKVAQTIMAGTLDDQITEYVLDLMRISKTHNLVPDMTSMQNAFYPYASDEKISSVGQPMMEKLRNELNFA